MDLALEAQYEHSLDNLHFILTELLFFRNISQESL